MLKPPLKYYDTAYLEYWFQAWTIIKSLADNGGQSSIKITDFVQENLVVIQKLLQYRQQKHVTSAINYNIKELKSMQCAKKKSSYIAAWVETVIGFVGEDSILFLELFMQLDHLLTQQFSLDATKLYLLQLHEL